MNSISFLSPEVALKAKELYGTPCFIYSEQTLKSKASEFLAFPNAYGLTVRYAMKAASNRTILKLFDALGLHFDASSGFEVERLLLAGVKPSKISLSTQELPKNIEELVAQGVSVNLCSLSQVEYFARYLPKEPIGLRFNPGLGSGGTTFTNTGGPASSFGIWHERVAQAKELTGGMQVFRIHTHIGSGSEPEVWVRAVELSLAVVEHFPEVRILNLGGGYKVARVPEEKTANLQKIGQEMRQKFLDFASRTGRELLLEIEPGTALLANSGVLLTTVQDETETGMYNFLKLDAGMTEICRPALYGAQHPMEVVKLNPSTGSNGQQRSYVVVGHCCESGDMLTPKPGSPEELMPRRLDAAEVGDLLIIGGAGAYCSSFSMKNYNSFPECPEVLLTESGELQLIRKRQTLSQIIENEI
jgi:diaminopimelate decarboxylase